MYVRPKLTFVSFYLFFFVHLPLMPCVINLMFSFGANFVPNFYPLSASFSSYLCSFLEIFEFDAHALILHPNGISALTWGRAHSWKEWFCLRDPGFWGAFFPSLWSIFSGFLEYFSVFLEYFPNLPSIFLSPNFDFFFQIFRLLFQRAGYQMQS